MKIVKPAHWFLIAAAALAEGGTMAAQASNNELELPAVIVEAEPRYVIGFPLLVAVTFANKPQGASFFDLPELDIFYSVGPIGLRLEPVGAGTPVSFPPSSFRGPSARMTLGPGERRKMLLDLSNFGLDLHPGKYQLTLTLKVARYQRSSEPVTVEFAAPSAADANEGKRLRMMGEPPTDAGAWAPFLKHNWNTVTVSPALSAEARRQLELHLFLHRAIYGPDAVGRLDPTPLRQLASPVLRGEAAVLEWEISQAPDAPVRPTQPAVPGDQQYRVEEIRRGGGLLTRYRKTVGAEQTFVHPPESFPYR